MIWSKIYRSSNTFNVENWIVFAFGLDEVKRGLQKFVLDEFINGFSMEIPDVIEHIKCLHRTGSPALEDLSSNAVALDIWSVVKCFLPKTGYRNVRSFEDLDVGGLLSLITTCKLFDEVVMCDLNEQNIFSELQNIHRQVFHTFSRDITKSELRCYLEKMIELLTDAKTIKNKKEAKEAVKQITQVLCNLYDVKHRPPEKVSTEFATNNTLSYCGASHSSGCDFTDSRARDFETGLCDEGNHLAEADSDLIDNSCNQLNAHLHHLDDMTALLLKKSSDPEDSRENFQHDTRESHEKTNDEMPVPDVLQAYRAVRDKDDICVRYQDLPTPKLFWVNPSSKSTTEQTEIVEFQWQAQTFPEVSNPREVGFDDSCEESVLLSCGSAYKTVEATEVTNQPMIKTTEPLDNVPDPKPSFQDKPEFEKEMIMYQPGLDTKIVPDVITNDKCEETKKTVLVETRNQDLKNREKISDKPQDDTDNHLDDTEKPRDDTEKPWDDTEKPRDDTDSHLDDTEKHLNDTSKYLDDTEKHLNDTDKCLEYTDKSIDDTDKHIDDTYDDSFGSGEVLQRPVKSESWIEDAHENLDGDGDTTRESLLEKVCKEKERTVNSGDEDSNGEHQPDDSFKLKLSKVPERWIVRVMAVVERFFRWTSSFLSDLDMTEDKEERVRSEKTYEMAFLYLGDCCCLVSSCVAFKRIPREENIYRYEWRRKRDLSTQARLSARDFRFIDRWCHSSSILFDEEEKELAFIKAVTHALEDRQIREDRWIRFEGEPEIRVEQSLKKRRGVMFGTVSRQGYLGCSDEPDEKLEGGIEQQACEARKSPWITAAYFLSDILKENLSSSCKKINSKISTVFVFMLLLCLSNAEVQENRLKKMEEESVAFSCEMDLCSSKVLNISRLFLPFILVADTHIEGMIGTEERTGAHHLGTNNTCNRRDATRERAWYQIQVFNAVLITERSDWQEQLGGVQCTVRAQSNCPEKTKELAWSQRQSINTDNLTQTIDWKEHLCAVQSTLRVQKNDLDNEIESQELAAINVQNVEELERLQIQRAKTTLLDLLLLNDSETELDCRITEEEHDLEFQYHTCYRCTEKNCSLPTYIEQCDIGEVYSDILTELGFVVVFLVVGITCCFISLKGDEFSYGVSKACLIPFYCSVGIFLIFPMRQIMKREVDDGDDVFFTGDTINCTKSILTKRIANICVALVILLVLSLLAFLYIGAVQILCVEKCRLKSYKINGYYGELNQNFDTEIKEGIICSEEGELDPEAAGTIFRNSCSYCEDKNEQQLEDCICLANKLLTLTYEDIENKRQLQQNLTLAEDLYNLNLEKQSNDGKPLTVDENEALVHEFSRIKPFSFPEGEDILNRSDTDQDFEVFEVEESQEKKHDSDSEDADNISIQNSEFTEHIDEQVGDCVKKVPRKASRRESNDGREVQSSSNGCGTDIRGAEGVQKEGAFRLFEVAEGDDKKLEVRVEIPLDALGGSIPLDNTYIGTGNRKPKATGQKKSKLRLQVFPNPHQGSRQYSDVDVAVEKKNSKSAFQNLNYKVKVESHSKKKIDSTFTEQDFDKYLEIRGYTWLLLNELPAPKLDPVSVAFLQTFEPVMVIIDQIANGTPPTPHVSMRYELLRFCTLRSYPKENKPHLIRLAMAGFYYASDSDGVVCYCCGVRRYNWVAKDDPMKVHQRINPNCKFLKKNEEVNVPVTYYGPYSEKLTYIMNIPEPVERPQVSEDVNNDWAPERIRSPAPAQQNSQNESGTNALGINTAIPKHPVYATKTTREASYNGWPDSSSHTPQELSDAGFFYAGFGDCVRCFYCGIGLRHWTKDDNPWIEHARWSRNCVYLRQKKGEEFVSLVQLALQYSQDNNSETNEASGNASASQDVEKILLSNAAQSVLEMGYQPKIIKRAIEELLRQNRNAKIVAQTLMEKLLEIEEAEDAVQTAEAPAAAKKTTPAQHTVKPESSLSSEGTKGTGASNTEGNSKKEGSGSIKAKSQTNDTSENSKVTSNELEKNDSKSLDPKTIKAENELLKEQTLCKVCLDNTVCIVFLPCGHLVTCADCAPAMRKCPICRALVKGTVRTYMS